MKKQEDIILKKLKNNYNLKLIDEINNSSKINLFKKLKFSDLRASEYILKYFNVIDDDIINEVINQNQHSNVSVEKKLKFLKLALENGLYPNEFNIMWAVDLLNTPSPISKITYPMLIEAVNNKKLDVSAVEVILFVCSYCYENHADSFLRQLISSCMDNYKESVIKGAELLKNNSAFASYYPVRWLERLMLSGKKNAFVKPKDFWVFFPYAFEQVRLKVEQAGAMGVKAELFKEINKNIDVAFDWMCDASCITISEYGQKLGLGLADLSKIVQAQISKMEIQKQVPLINNKSANKLI